MASTVAKTASVDSRARLASEVLIGPGCVIGPEVEIGRGTQLFGHVCLMGVVKLGEFNTIGPFVAIGGEPQDLSYWGKTTRVQIGDHNVIGERVTIHRASEKEDGVTIIGNNNQFLIGAHVAHDCKLADRITMGMGSLLGGHVRVECDATISENVAVHQFVTVGNDSFIGAHSKITTDVPRYMRVEGNPSVVRGINGQRLKERGVSGKSLAALREAHRLLYVVKMPLEQAATLLDENGFLVPEVLLLLKFLESQHAGKVGRARERRR
ncbi:MAG: acyl-ACP--UDP-N-acetylglucosamine O-acyltransferase [Isosphaeraceae bacterium]